MAQEVQPCDGGDYDAIVEPWEQNARSFANGDVRIALLDRIEPAAGALQLLILSPPRDELGARQCRLLTYAGGQGFAALDFTAITAGYDPARGLTFAVPARFVLPDSGFSNTMLIDLTLNQASGEIGLDVQLGPE